jgi:sugar phosphate isomerase/epimerase
MKLGVFTVSMPDYEPIETLEKLKELGYDGAEWRVTEDPGDKSNPTFWGGNRTTLTAEELLEKADELKAKAAELGLEIPSLGTYISMHDQDRIEISMKACAAVGAKNLRIGSGGYDPEAGTYPEQIKNAKKLYAGIADKAKEIGVRAVIETHMGQLAPSVTKAMRILEDLDPAHVGIMWDPGNQVLEGREVYRMAIEEAGDYLAEVHAKNLRWEKGDFEDGRQKWKCNSCPLREGGADWVEVINVLKNAGYDGWIFFEDFSTEVPLDQRLKENHDWFRELIG